MKKKSKWQRLLESYVGLKMELSTLQDDLYGVKGCSDGSWRKREAARIQQRIREIEGEVVTIEEAINRIPDPIQRVVLRRKYIGNWNELPTWSEVVVMLRGDNDEKDMQNIYRLHGRALQSFEEYYKVIQEEKSHL